MKPGKSQILNSSVFRDLSSDASGLVFVAACSSSFALVEWKLCKHSRKKSLFHAADPASEHKNETPQWIIWG
jgi:hypothetical protein